jgi:hypothetical protein
LAIIVEPTLTCDGCETRIEPGAQVANLYFGKFIRVETPNFMAPYADIKEDPDVDFYMHPECVADFVYDAETLAQEQEWAAELRESLDRQFAAKYPYNCTPACGVGPA